MIRKIGLWFIAITSGNMLIAQDSIPNTGISGVYEVVVGTAQAAPMIRYFGEFGFRVVDSAKLTATQANQLYGISVGAKVFRLQNGAIDSHGLLRIISWDKLLGPGVGYTEPETVGQRLSVMLTKDIIRITDIYQLLRTRQEKWLPTVPVFDDPLRINAGGEIGFFKRPVGVRENAVYGEFFNHVFFQRYGYTIPGYGTIDTASPLQTSEFTHHDFCIKIDSMQQLMYLQTALGLKAERAPVIDGDNNKGPKATFLMPDGYAHYYQGFVSPNNICGKLKFFMAVNRNKPDASARQRLGEAGITMHTFYTPKLLYVHELISKHGLRPTPTQKNEFGEVSFVFKGPEGATWQIIEQQNKIKHQPEKILSTLFTKD
ncbi:MAG: hypothetical protein WCH59_05850 [Chitinophagia bacterium]|jgi:hypothetical protein